MRISKKWLIVTNGILWMVAGANILRIGIQSILTIHSLVWLLCIPIFIAFYTMFAKIISKNSKRILSLNSEKARLYQFLTLKGYLIIAFMMTLGITLRKLGSIPESFFAFFYTGLGSALFFAGLLSISKLLFRR